MLAGMLRGDHVRLENETLIDQVRTTSSPESVSRLEGMYLFEDLADAAKHIDDPNWPAFFQWENLVEVDVHSSNWTRVDANWITYAPLDSLGRIPSADLDWIPKYWSGAPRGPNPTWEVVTTGVAIVLDETVRRSCYQPMREVFPKAEIFLLMSRLAGEAGSNGGLISPFIGWNDEGNAHLHYLLDDAAFSLPEVITGIMEHPDAAYLGMLMTQQEMWPLPDFRPWGKVF